MRRFIECWIGKKFLKDLREIIIYVSEICLIRGYIMAEKEAKEIAKQEGWKAQKTASH